MQEKQAKQRSGVHEHSWPEEGMVNSDFFFKIKSNLCLDTLIQKIIFLIAKINDFRGDLSNVSV